MRPKKKTFLLGYMLGRNERERREAKEQNRQPNLPYSDTVIDIMTGRNKEKIIVPH